MKFRYWFVSLIASLALPLVQYPLKPEASYLHSVNRAHQLPPTEIPI